MTASKHLADLLTEFFRRKQEAKKSYSLRAFARDMKLSASHISRALSGKKVLSSTQLSKAFKILDIDRETQSKILDLYARHKLGSLQYKYFPEKSKAASLLEFRRLSKNKISLLSKWYFIPVLEMISINSSIGVKGLAEKLGITTGMVEESLKTLENLEVIHKVENKWVRNVERIRLASASSKPEIRQFHSEMLQKAQAQLRRTDENSFNLRLITGITIGADPELLDRAKAILNDALHKASEILNTENSSEVYQINLQLFPLTRSK